MAEKKSLVQTMLEEKTNQYAQKMPYLKALIVSELQNDIEIFRFINNYDIVFKQEVLDDNFISGLRGGMNELFTYFKKQFQKVKTSSFKQQNSLENDNYQVSITYDKYYLRKKEIASNILLVIICDIEKDGYTPQQADRIKNDIKNPGATLSDQITAEQSTFNIG